MIDFRKLMSPEAVARMDAETREIERLWVLDDRWLAREILQLARKAREFFPDQLGDYARVEKTTYSTVFVWDLIPEISARLGETQFMLGERSAEFRAASADELRGWASSIMNWLGRFDQSEVPLVRGFHVWDLLSHSFVNGNPVIFALDRVAPPTNESKDWCARHMREISQTRGFAPTSAWSPELNGPTPQRDDDFELPAMKF